MVKLLNNTKLSNDLLNDILTTAGRSVKAKTTSVVVQVNSSKRSGGRAFECYRVRWTKNNQKKSTRWIETDGGAFKIKIPLNTIKFFEQMANNEKMAYSKEELFSEIERICTYFFEVAQHEFGHIKDFQNGGRRRLEFSSKENGKRPSHRLRPEEVRADNYVFDARYDKSKVEELINNLIADVKDKYLIK